LIKINRRKNEKSDRRKRYPTSCRPLFSRIRVKDKLFTSGQLPINPETNELVKGDIKLVAKQILKTLKI
jgi:2-iminobutanoate/2-iminopropanoate deaminase